MKPNIQPQNSVDEIYQSLLVAFEDVEETQRLEFAIMVVISLCDQIEDRERIAEILTTCRLALEEAD